MCKDMYRLLSAWLWPLCGNGGEATGLGLAPEVRISVCKYVNIIADFRCSCIVVWTYAIASKLPTTILDGLLTFPHILLSVRNTLFGRNALPYPPPPVVPSTTRIPAAAHPRQQPPAIDPAGESDAEHETLSQNGSDADVESSSGYGSGVGESWISLQPDLGDHAQPWR